MRLLISSLFFKNPWTNLQKHADMVKECAHLFREAMICHMGGECREFDLLTDKVAQLESQADAVKRNIRNHLPKGILLPVDKFQFMDYLREQDKVLDEVEEALFWLSFRPQAIPEAVACDILHLVEAVIPTIEKLSDLVDLACKYFRSRSEAQRRHMKRIVRDIRQAEREADLVERDLKYKIFSSIQDAMVVFHLVRLAEILGHIADHAQNASDRMRTMIAR